MKFLQPIDLTNLEIQNVKAQNLATDPTAVVGKFYYNTADGTLRFYSGVTSSWVNLGRLDQISAPTAAVSLNNQKITNLATPTNAGDAANKQYVDDSIQGLDAKASVKAATTANIASLAGGAPNTLDGVTLAANDRILVKDQTTQSQNGIYVVTTLGSGANGTWTRASDMDVWTEVPSAFTFVEQGNTYAETGWVVSADQGGTINTTSITWVQFSAAGQITASNEGTGQGVFKQKAGTVLEFYSLATPAGQGALTLSLVSNDVTFTVSAIVEALNDLATTGIIARTGAGTLATRTITGPAAGITVSNGDGVAGNPTLSLANDLAGLEGLTGTGGAYRTGADTWANRTLQQPAAGITITNPAGVAGNPTFVLANDLAGLEGLGTTGIAVRTATDTWTTRQIVQPAAGITITNPAGVAGDVTLALANDLAGLEGLTGTGFSVRTGTDTWTTRTITTASGSKITISNGDGAAGNPTIDIVETHKDLVRTATTGTNITLSGGAPNTLDGVTLAANDRILVKDQTTGSQNGIYTVTTLGTGSNGTWTRSTDADTSAEVKDGLTVTVEQGTIHSHTTWMLTTNNAITLGTTSLTFARVDGTGRINAGAGLVKGTENTATANTLNVEVLSGGGLSFDTAGDAGKLQVDSAVVVRKFAQTIGDNSATSFVLTHNFNTRDITTQVYDASTFEKVEVNVTHTTVNTATISFAVAPATNSYRVVIHG